MIIFDILFINIKKKSVLNCSIVHFYFVTTSLQFAFIFKFKVVQYFDRGANS